jgi:hypothetical protein
MRETPKYGEFVYIASWLRSGLQRRSHAASLVENTRGKEWRNAALRCELVERPTIFNSSNEDRSEISLEQHPKWCNIFSISHGAELTGVRTASPCRYRADSYYLRFPLLLIYPGVKEPCLDDLAAFAVQVIYFVWVLWWPGQESNLRPSR